jgi:undecaprenyl-diphosphatase
MTILEAIILGIIQGLTEFLPVSSSGHLELGAAILNAYESEPLLFTVAVHAATALSTIVVFRKDLANIIRDLLKFRWNDSWDFVAKIAVSMIPIAIVGVFFEEEVEAFFGGRTLLVGCMLLITALLLSFTYFVRDVKGGPVTYGKAAIIGIAQTLAIMPGISRSGSTIATALLMKVDKEKATRFSFLMVLIPILGASALKLKDYIEAPAGEFDNIAGMPLLVGFLAAFVAGLAACQWMIKIVKRGKLIWFAVYCAIVGTVAILVSLFG